MNKLHLKLINILIKIFNSIYLNLLKINAIALNELSIIYLQNKERKLGDG